VLVEPDGNILWYHPPGTLVATVTKGITKNTNNSCSDVGDGDFHTINPFTLVKEEWGSMEHLNGTLENATDQKIFTNWIPRAYSLPPNDLSITGIPSDNSSVTTAAARSNPGRIQMHLPVAIAELRDIPHMIKQGGDLLRRFLSSNRSAAAVSSYLGGLASARDGAGIYLGYQFGIRPIISDVQKMLQFTQLVDRRVNELERLYSNGGLRRRVNVFTGTDSSSAIDNINTDLAVVIQARKTLTTTVKKWATLHWKPTALPTIVHGEALRRRAWSLVTGTSGDGHQIITEAWEALPWSWFIDWFDNVGNFLQAHSNAVPTAMDRCSIMYNTETICQWSRLPGNDVITGGNASFTRSRKNRISGSLSPLPVADIPFLNGGQLSILSALSVARFR
jgi:hypothetical protein